MKVKSDRHGVLKSEMILPDSDKPKNSESYQGPEPQSCFQDQQSVQRVRQRGRILPGSELPHRRPPSPGRMGLEKFKTHGWQYLKSVVLNRVPVRIRIQPVQIQAPTPTRNVQTLQS